MSSSGPRASGAGDSDPRAGRTTSQPRAQATRLAILTAAAEHFARHGYHATSLDRVLVDSGGTKGALYFHFASKEALARAVIAEMKRGWRELRGQVGDRGLDPLSELVALVDGVIARLIDSPIARGGTRLLDDLPVHARDVGEHYGVGEDEASTLLTRAAHTGLLREGVQPVLVARQIVAVLAGHLRICDAVGECGDLRWRVDEAWTLLLPAIATDAWLTTWRAGRCSHEQDPHEQERCQET